MLLSSSSKLNDDMLNVTNKILASHSIDVNIQDKDGNTALHLVFIPIIDYATMEYFYLRLWS